MLSTPFASLDRCTVAIELSLNGLSRMLRGRAAYECDLQLGKLLRISIHEAIATFDVILQEEAWDGEIASGGSSGCDYRVKLAINSVCGR